MIAKPLPPMNAWSEPFWQAARQGRLIIQHCRACGRNIFYPRLACPFCFADQPEWIEASGRGTVYSYSVVQNNAPSAFLEDMPFVIAIVRLEEDVQLMTNIVGCNPDTVRCQMPVEVVFERLTEEITLPKFRPRGQVARPAGGHLSGTAAPGPLPGLPASWPPGPRADESGKSE